MIFASSLPLTAVLVGSLVDPFPITETTSPPAVVPVSAPAPIPPASRVLAQDDEGFDLSYTYLELGFGILDIDAFDDDADWIYGRASVGLLGFLHVFLDYQNFSADFEDTDADLFGLGAGGHFGVTDHLDLIGEASWLTADIESDLANLDDDNEGYSIFAGARWLVLPLPTGGIEVNGGYRWIDLEGLYSEAETQAWEAGGRFHFLKLFSVGTKVGLYEDDTVWGFDARVSL